MNYGPLVRIFLRYVVGGVFVGSQAVGEQLAADPDVVAGLAALVGVGVEAFWVLAKKKGWAL